MWSATPLSGFPRHVATRFPQLLGRRVAVALSGGADSVALLHLLRAPELTLELVAIHVHHGVRGAEADADASFCQQLCDTLGVPWHRVDLDPADVDPEGREAGWRRRRYAALRRVAADLGAVAVATGHHFDDVAEGVLLQLLRGAGPRAMAGILATTEDGVVRPLLPWRRRQLETWLRARRIGWREDSSNRSLHHLRNLVRHRLLPELESASPRLRRHLVQLAADLAADEAMLADQLARRAAWIDPWHPDGGVPLTTVARLEPPLRSRWLHAQLARSGIGRATRRQIELLDGLLDRGQPRAIALAGRWRLRRAAGRLWLEPPVPPPPVSRRLTPGDELALPIPGWRLRLGPAGAGRGGGGWRWRPPAATQLALRGPEPGDRVLVDGRPRRLASLLAGRLPRHLRRAWPVLVADARIVWIPGVWTCAEHTGVGDVEVEVTRT